MAADDLVFTNGRVVVYDDPDFDTPVSSYAVGDKWFFAWDATMPEGSPPLEGQFLFDTSHPEVLGLIEEVWQNFPPGWYCHRRARYPSHRRRHRAVLDHRDHRRARSLAGQQHRPVGHPWGGRGRRRYRRQGPAGHHHLRYPTSLMNQRAALDALLAVLEMP